MSYLPQPSLADFITFIRNVMQIDSDDLPDDAPVIPIALSFALARVPRKLNAVGYAPVIAGTVPVNIYTACVYNLAGDNIINFAPDPTSPPGDADYFTNLRTKMNIGAFVSGVIQSAGDESTNESMVVQKAAENFTLQDLQNLKTPWGRQALAYMQMIGPTVIGFN